MEYSVETHLQVMNDLVRAHDEQWIAEVQSWADRAQAAGDTVRASGHLAQVAELRATNDRWEERVRAALGDSPVASLERSGYRERLTRVLGTPEEYSVEMHVRVMNDLLRAHQDSRIADIQRWVDQDEAAGDAVRLRQSRAFLERLKAVKDRWEEDQRAA